MRNLKLLIEYDGTNYSGWQRQENGPTIQGEIERALSQILQQSVNVIGAGRTDAGVHARGQTANVQTNATLQLYEIKHGLNALLPEDIVIHTVEEVSSEFHARYSAKERCYSYSITRTPVALLRNYSWYVKYALNIDPMRWASAAILGTHDFESFCKANSDVEHYRCTILSASWQAEETMLTFTIRADRFLHGMVRALVGTIVDVGRGYISLEDFLDILSKKNRSAAGMAAPAKGLVLEQVIY